MVLLLTFMDTADDDIDAPLNQRIRYEQDLIKTKLNLNLTTLIKKHTQYTHIINIYLQNKPNDTNNI